MTVTTALYRRYRPDSFADVIGQEHVTEPLMTALRKNRVNHAYLFSGPRGCGKTTSARILARCLNCAQGPTDTPCGTCPSCIELARGGSGSLDVIEIDAASHGGVDDARDLRERATYAPVRDRYKIFIIDEAHMVTSAGFNALLKIVEEPPEHIKFIFATTEPDKVIGTIRSRTHHYPFRLVPPEPLMAYLELLCRQENVPVAPGVLSLVIRAGGGSVRDSLSVLDQLMAGAGPSGLDYELAVALLGYTHASLLDDVVEAVAASDAATVFRAVDRVIQTGHDPRRFVEDLLERFRDLIIVQAMPESAQTILRGMPADQIARLQNQAHNLGAAELSRAADVTNTALTEMTGATSPRLHLELLCARILLPSSEQTERGIAARIDRVERRLNYAGTDAGSPAAAIAAPRAASSSAAPAMPADPSGPSQRGPERPEAVASAAAPLRRGLPPETPVSNPTPAVPAEPRGQAARDGEAAQAGHAEPGQPLTAPRVTTADWPREERPDGRQTAPANMRAAQALPEAAQVAKASGSTPAPHPLPVNGAAPVHNAGPVQSAGPMHSGGPVHDARPAAGREPEAAAAPRPPAASATSSSGDVEVLRRAWPEILQALSKIKRSTWALVEPNAQVGAFDGQVLTLAFTTTGLAGAFGRADHSDNLRQAIHKTVGIDCQITAVSGSANSPVSSEPNPKAPVSPEAQATSADVAWGLAPAPAPGAAPVQQPASPVDASTPGQNAAPSQSAVQSPAKSHSESPEREPAKPLPQDATAGSASPVRPEATPDEAAPAVGPSGVQAVHSGKEEAAAAPGLPSAAGAQAADPGLNTEGTYSYSDDDWGPPRDEDAPPLDEEPPMDWAPPAPGDSQQGLDSQQGPAAIPAAVASRPAKNRAETTPRSGGKKQAPSPEASKPDTSHDPWTRAVEQAPGIWVMGSESNVGKSPATAAAEPAIPETAPAPAYEPATAQIPGPAAVRADPDAEASWGLSPVPVVSPEATTVPAATATTPEQVPEQVTNSPREPVYAMASSAPPAAPQPAPATSPAAAAARQSLYQRLSNSPEAEAGRAKAPARVVAASTTYVQDIPSSDDETIEESGVFGRAAVERILGGKLIEERSPDGSPLPPRF
ncbi:DNA polymerase III subunit gamma and tau [Arthrobacter sp. CDRTa11]|uniref:DNA polymerase III subunit gamma and tau n=1 Tax=Arthrobacter sp. CDRTa11 TaxID=2651199 RepID=UPI002265EAB3|nr:DNA polymerase III subunit gamma and tau [Arthrobacter sp. CDRTa11]UZX01824.1 DNA polymerase III subunit gamma and tau [Arthrobacter sp. CDRTa11]